jgi:hypothetical protein
MALTPQYVAEIKEFVRALNVCTWKEEWQSVLEQFPTIPDFEKRKPDILKIIAEGINESDLRILEECNKYKGQHNPNLDEVKRKRKLGYGVKRKVETAYHALGERLYPTFYRSVSSSLPFVLHPLC